jgi:hypothetical protein
VKYTRLFILLLFLSAILQSCSIEKRLYNKGFHVENNFFKKENIEKAKVDLSTDGFLAQETSSMEETIQPQSTKQEKEVESKKIIQLQEQECDTLYFKNGTKILCEIRYAGKDEVVYKVCGNPKGYNQHSKTSEIEKISYANGETKRFYDEYDYVTDTGYIDDSAEGKKTQQKAILSFILGLLGLVTYGLAGFAAFFIARSVLKTYDNNPHYKGKGFAIAGYMLGILVIVAYILAFIFVAWYIYMLLI